MRATLAPAFVGHQRRLQGRHRHRLQPAADPGPEHDRRLRVLPPGPPRRRRSSSLAEATQQVRRPRPTSGPSCAACRRTFTRQRAAVPHRRRPREGEGARRADQRRLRHACRARSAPLRQRLQRCTAAPISVQPVVRSRLPRAARRPAACLRALRQRRHGAADRAGRPSRASSGPDMVERFNIFPAAKILGSPRRATARARRSRRWRRSSRKTLPADFTLDWTGSAYQELATGGTGALGFVLRPGDGVPDPGRAVRALVAAARGAPAVPFALFGALLAVWLRGLDERRLLPDRPGDADRPGREERDPDRRVRGSKRHGRACRPTTRRSRPRGCASGRSS